MRWSQGHHITLLLMGGAAVIMMARTGWFVYPRYWAWANAVSSSARAEDIFVLIHHAMGIAKAACNCNYKATHDSDGQHASTCAKMCLQDTRAICVRQPHCWGIHAKSLVPCDFFESCICHVSLWFLWSSTGYFTFQTLSDKWRFHHINLPHSNHCSCFDMFWFSCLSLILGYILQQEKTVTFLVCHLK